MISLKNLRILSRRSCLKDKIITSWWQSFLKYSLLEKVVLLAPVLVWFSYYPNFHFGTAGGANLEFSITLIYVVVLAALGLPSVWKSRQVIFNKKIVWLTGLFVFWNILSVVWSPNTIRTILTSGVWLVIWLDFLAVLSLSDITKLIRRMTKIFVFMSLVISIVAIAQVIYGTWIDWGLCRGCLARGFGFTRPSAFTIEPQFLGNLLLVPILYLLHKQFTGCTTKIEKIILWINLLVLYLTLSRGAIFAGVISMVVMIFIGQKMSKKVIVRNTIITIVLLISSFSAGLIFHGIFTQLNPRVTDGFYESISKSINHISLGKISLPNHAQKSSSFDTKQIDPGTQPHQPQQALFDGYVERSTNERTNMIKLALETWRRNSSTIWFGVGSGATGSAIYAYTGKISRTSEITQNQTVEILLENGLVGVIIVLGIIILFSYWTRVYKWSWVVLLAFLIQWNFFSGLPNALHIYLILAVIFATIGRVNEQEKTLS
jgi:hypothetical protein